MRVEKSEIQPTTRYEIARWVSTIIHPIAVPLLTLGIAIYVALRSPLDTLKWLGLALAVTTVPISALVSVQVLRHKWTDLDVSVRRQRYTLYPFGIACLLALVIIFIRFHAPWIAVQATLGLTIANVVNGLINLVYKVSAHATGAAASATILAYAVPALAIPSALAALLVGWSRVELKRHTVGQVALGLGVGLATMLVTLSIGDPR